MPADMEATTNRGYPIPNADADNLVPQLRAMINAVDLDIDGVTGGTGPVTSFNGRTGAVSSVAGDYNAFYQPLNAKLSAIAALANAAGMLRNDGAGAFSYDSSTYATQAYVNSAVVGLLDDRGNYDASGNAFPSSGGSGSAGAILKGDLWTISVAGTLGGHAVTPGDVVRALVDTPGSTDANWAIGENNFGYVALNQALADGKIYIGNASGMGTAVTPSGDVTISNAGVTAIGSGKVTNSMLAGSIAFSKLLGTDRTLTAGGGLTGGGDLSADRTVAMGTPSTLSTASTNAVSGTTHGHAISSSANPGAAQSLLATDVSGYLQLVRLGIGGAPSQPLEVTGNVFINNATANLFLKNTSTGFQSASTLIVTPQVGNSFRNNSYTSGLTGWNISDAGNAEFANVDVRGAIHSAVFVYNALLATSGTLGVFKSSAKLRSDVTVPGSPTYGTTAVNIDVVDQDGLTHAASQLFVGLDILRLKDGLAGDTWFKVVGVVDQTTYWRYTATIEAGSNNVTYRAGAAVADYGQTGQGFIIQTADQANSPYLQMATHSASFSSADASGTLNVTPQLRVGNLNGSFGYSSAVYGLGAGQYGTSGKSWLTVEQTNGIRIGNNTSTHFAVDLSGNVTVGEAGVANVYISSGSIDISSNSTSRVHLAADGSGYLANSAISWDTAGNLSVAGNAKVGGFSVGSDYVRDNANSFGLASTVTGGDDVRFWAGDTFANRATAPFFVTEAGVVQMSAGSIAGKLTMSGSGSAIAIGTTPPTSATVGTGLWLDRNALYALDANTQRSVLSSTGLKIQGTSGSPTAVLFDYTPGTASGFLGALADGVTLLKSTGPLIGSAINALQASIPLGDDFNSPNLVELKLTSYYSSGSKMDLRLSAPALASGTMSSAFSGDVQPDYGSASNNGVLKGFTVGADDAPNAMLDVRGTGVFTDNLTLAKSVIYTGAASSTYHMDVSSVPVSKANNATVDFSNFSGMVMCNDFDNGNVTVYIMGGGNVTVLGSATGQAGTMAYNAGISGYRWTNNSGATHDFSFIVFRSRPTA